MFIQLRFIIQAICLSLNLFYIVDITLFFFSERASVQDAPVQYLLSYCCRYIFVIWLYLFWNSQALWSEDFFVIFSLWHRRSLTRKLSIKFTLSFARSFGYLLISKLKTPRFSACLEDWSELLAAIQSYERSPNEAALRICEKYSKDGYFLFLFTDPSRLS